ncbi:hypothetical protein BUALT_Bualt13G0092000 [Buddleja alternifolia]|uniref:RRM domain-containing protein n=1 Tax=Buddleja alternifolia TaxID=168488 RepID=A0AAV6WUG0_9LAMI|nr:hypothetical protein BUALT_Bualt13G0092000 [Buddleja alternifolia]
MSHYRRSRYSASPRPCKRYRSISRSLSRSRSRSYDSSDAENPGNNLYVTGLSTRVTRRDLEKHFSSEGKVEDVHLVIDPWTRESRGFGFVTMSTLGEANRCIKYLDRSVLEGRVITVEKARRRRGRTPTPGRYLGLRTVHVCRRSPSYSPYSRSWSPRYSSERDRSRSRSYSPYYSRRRRRSYSPYYKYARSYYCSRSRSPSYSRSPVSRRDRDRSYSPYYYRDYSPDDRYDRGRDRDYSPEDSYYRGRRRDYPPDERYYGRGRYYRRSYSCSVSPRSYSRSVSPGYSKRSCSRSVSPSPRKILRRHNSCSVSPRPSKSLKRNSSRGSRKRVVSHDSRSSRSHSRSPCSVSSSSRSS